MTNDETQAAPVDPALAVPRRKHEAGDEQLSPAYMTDVEGFLSSADSRVSFRRTAAYVGFVLEQGRVQVNSDRQIQI